MTDCHIHLERGPYTLEWLDKFVAAAVSRGVDEIYLLEHSHRFSEFLPMYQSVGEYNDYQRNWLERKGSSSLSLRNYTALIELARGASYPIKIKFGLEICYFEDAEPFIRDMISQFPFDFVTGSVHWVDGFGFDHKKELWDNINVEHTYIRYYIIMQKLIKSGLFTGLAHPDSMKCFGHTPELNLSGTYHKLADLLKEHHMYAEQSGGLRLNYSSECELGMNERMRAIFVDKGVRILTASDAHRPEDVGANIFDLERLLTGQENKN